MRRIVISTAAAPGKSMLGAMLVFALPFAAALTSWSAVAEQNQWPARFNLPFYQYSTDTEPVEVTIRHFNDADVSQRVVLRIPRAYLVFVPGYEADRISPLPDALEAQSVTLALTFPDGEPLSAHAAAIAAEQGVGLREAILNLRPQTYEVELGYIAPGIPWETRVRELVEKHNTRIGVYDGLEHFRDVTSDIFLGKSETGGLIRVSCSLEARAKPNHLCTVRMRLGENLSVNAMFLDFRFHGGREYLNERTRIVRESVCRFAVSLCES